ncbi:MAG: GNAT family N-acetyltransferase, partial [Terriglobales bacterium]
AEIRRLRSEDWDLLRRVRLAALHEAPRAFGSTHGRESAFTEVDWRSRLITSAWFIALVGDRPIGVAAGMHRDDVEYRRELLSMWVDPDWRGAGVAAELVVAVQDWAKNNGANLLKLCVADGNDRARRFYEKLGFTPTGAREPLANNPGVDTTEFTCPL